MKKHLVYLVVIVSLAGVMAGCATAKQAVEDYKTGASVPLADGELSPAQQAQPIVGAVSTIPVVGGFAPLIGSALVALFTAQRGKRIRKNNGTSTNPISGYWGSNIGLETLIQGFSNVVSGLFEVGADNSGLKRGWKVALTTALSLGAGALAVPAVHDFVLANPMIVAGITGLSGLFAGLEKEISKVKPLAPTT